MTQAEPGVVRLRARVCREGRPAGERRGGPPHSAQSGLLGSRTVCRDLSVALSCLVSYTLSQHLQESRSLYRIELGVFVPRAWGRLLWQELKPGGEGSGLATLGRRGDGGKSAWAETS